jgi:hypothetical protein
MISKRIPLVYDGRKIGHQEHQKILHQQKNVRRMSDLAEWLDERICLRNREFK